MLDGMPLREEGIQGPTEPIVVKLVNGNVLEKLGARLDSPTCHVSGPWGGVMGTGMTAPVRLSESP